jgi:hypothetical protein
MAYRAGQVEAKGIVKPPYLTKIVLYKYAPAIPKWVWPSKNILRSALNFNLKLGEVA